MNSSISQLLDHLEKSGLVPSGRIESLRLSAGEFQDADAFAASLVQQNVITPYQAKHLLAGRSGGFFIAKYRILEPIGRGGMGRVFRAYDSKLGRPVALKVLRSEASRDKRMVARFLREARAAAQLDHENIVRVYDSGRVGEISFIAMEFVPGRDLSHLIKERRRLPEDETVAIMRQVLAGLDHVYHRGVVHRDIKPSNLLITREGTIKILDMGIAQFSDNLRDSHSTQEEITQSGEIMGTVDYIAPEQAEDSRRADIRSDIYSLGCLVYQCLSGKLPFPNGTMVQKLLARGTDEPDPLAQVAPDVSPEICALIERMMEREPNRRFQTPIEVIAALRPFLQADVDSSPSGETIGVLSTKLDAIRAIARAAEDVPPLKFGKQRQRRPRAGRVIIVSLVLLIVFLTSAYFWTSPATLALDFQGTLTNDTNVLLDGKPVTGDRWQVSPGFHTIEIQKPGYGPFTKRVRTPRSKLTSIAVTLQPTEATVNEETARLLRHEIAELIDVPHNTPASLNLRSRLIKSWQNQRPAARGPLSELISQLRWPADSLDGSKIPEIEIESAKLSAGVQAYPELVGLQGQSQLKHWARVGSVAFSPTHENLIASVARDGVMNLWDSSNGRLLQRRLHESWIDTLEFAHDGTVIYGCEDGRVEIVDPETGKSIHSFQAHDDWIQALAAHPSEKLFATGGRNGLIQVWDWSVDPPQSKPIRGHSSNIGSLTFSPDGSLLASGSYDHTVRIWNSKSATELVTLVGHEGRVRALAFHPTESRLVSGADDLTLIIWDVQGGTQILHRRTESQALSMAFDRAGKVLYIGSRNGTLSQRGFPSYSRLGSATFAGSVSSVSLSKDGTKLGIGTGTNHHVKILDAENLDAENLDAKDLDAKDLESKQSRRDVHHIASDPQGRWVALADLSPPPQIWDFESDSPSVLNVDLPGPVQTLAASVDGSSLMCGGPGQITTVDLETLTTTHTFQDLGRQPILDLGCSFRGEPDKTIVAYRTLASVELLDAATMKAGPALQLDLAQRTSAAVLSPDGKTLAVSTRDGPIWLLDTESGKVRNELHTISAERTRSIAFSPDGNSLATTVSDSISEIGKVQLWDLTTFRSKALLQPHQGRLRALAYSRDGEVLASGGSDGSVTLWNVRSGLEQDRLQIGPPLGQIVQITYTPDGRHLLIVNGNWTVYVYRLRTHRHTD